MKAVYGVYDTWQSMYVGWWVMVMFTGPTQHVKVRRMWGILSYGLKVNIMRTILPIRWDHQLPQPSFLTASQSIILSYIQTQPAGNMFNKHANQKKLCLWTCFIGCIVTAFLSCMKWTDRGNLNNYQETGKYSLGNIW